MTKNKKEGFYQKAIIIPNKVINKVTSSALLNSMYVTDIGFYSKAKYHHLFRKEGVPQYIMVLCTEGSGWFQLEGKKYVVEANQFFFLPTNKQHSYGASSLDPWSIYWIHFKGVKADQIYEKIKQLPDINILTEQSLEDCIAIFNTMYSTLEMGYSDENLNYINMTLYYFLGMLVFDNHSKPVSKFLQEEDIVTVSIKYMKSILHEQINLKQLASQTKYSTSHFSLLFKNKTGNAPIDYFISLKIQKACQYLDFSALKIKEICQLLGYEDPYYFSRIFKKHIGDSPLEYRNRKKG